jgi:hypothetical protein
MRVAYASTPNSVTAAASGYSQDVPRVILLSAFRQRPMTDGGAVPCTRYRRFRNSVLLPAARPPLPALRCSMTRIRCAPYGHLRPPLFDRTANCDTVNGTECARERRDVDPDSVQSDRIFSGSRFRHGCSRRDSNAECLRRAAAEGSPRRNPHHGLRPGVCRRPTTRRPVPNSSRSRYLRAPARSSPSLRTRPSHRQR